MGILVFRDRDGRRDFLGRIDFSQEATPASMSTASASFIYDSDYLMRARAAGELGISELLPLDSAPYAAEEFGPFFRGLLPEGEVYGNLAELYQVSRSDYLAMLEQMGCESIGALTFMSTEANPSEYEPAYDPVSRETLSDMARNPARMATLTARATRLSLSGAQSKVAWCLPSGIDAGKAAFDDWLIPRGSAPSTHIIKIARRGEEGIALNELACSLLASACGIRTAKVTELLDVPGVIAVERYDRVRVSSGDSSAVVRLHQEDFCQALGLAPFFKYQPLGVDANYPAMAAGLIESASSDPQADKLEFAKRLAFCFAVGNADAHLKNFSLLYNQAWTARRLAPLYDVTCIPLTGYSQAMPFDVGWHRSLGDIDERDIVALASDLGVGLQLFDRAVEQVVGAFESPDVGEVSCRVAGTVERILENAAPRVEVLKRYLG